MKSGLDINILDTIGNTPLVELKRQDTGKCRLFVKLENQNPGGSIKDRIALSMINEAERSGKLAAGGTIVEATAGNTGIGLTLVGKLKGYKVTLVIPDKMSLEKINLLRAMGAEVILTRSDVNKGHPLYYQDMAEQIANEIPGSFYTNQFCNPANPLAHERTTGPEIFRQMNGKIDAVICGVGSSGTLTGLTHFFGKAKPDVEMIVADPEGSVISEYIKTGRYGKAGSWFVEGIGEDFIPGIADFSLTRNAYTITDDESFNTARRILREEGILIGSSSGTLIAAALKYCREQKHPNNVVTFVCDSGNKYISKMYNEYWLRDQGFRKQTLEGNLSDFVSRRFTNKEVICLRTDDLLKNAYDKMKQYEISQIPVLEDNSITGIIDESDVLGALIASPDLLNAPVRSYMTRKLITLAPEDSLSDVLKIFSAGMVPIIVENGRFIGLITKIDIINFLAKNKVTAHEIFN